MVSAESLTPTDFQCLVALARYGRRGLRQRWAALLAPASAKDAAETQQIPPLTLEPSQCERLLPGLNRQPLPWQMLREQMLRHGFSAQIGPRLPEPLRAMPDPPLALYVRGNAELLSQLSVAVVGARRCSHRAALFTEQLARDLAEQGVVVVSGLALGIDAAAHRGALQMQPSGSTVAVLGSGLLRPAPRSNAVLMERILARAGAVVSEYPPTIEASKYHFPERNRIITGLSAGVVVVEAGARSGSLISARLALEQGRDVMAVPGPVGMPGSVGCHRLLKQGAALVESAQDVLEVLNIDARLPPGAAAEQGPGAAAGPAHPLLAHIDATATTMDTLVAATGLSASTLSTLLTRLELDGFVQRVAQGYIRSP